MNNLHNARKLKGYTQEEVAKALSIRQSDYSKYERGINALGIEKFKTLAVFYNLSIDYLSGLVDEPKHLNNC